jgi:hypothetical protein
VVERAVPELTTEAIAPGQHAIIQRQSHAVVGTRFHRPNSSPRNLMWYLYRASWFAQRRCLSCHTKHENSTICFDD